MVEIQEDAKDDNREDDKPLEHVTQYDKNNGDDQKHYPTYMYRDQFIVGLIDIV
jgi:hypothetical protein